MGAVLGLNAKAYYQTDGAGGSAGWNELVNIKDLSLNMEKAEADVTTRGADGWRATIGTLKEGAVEFQMVWDTSDTGFNALQQAFFNDTLIGLQILDGPGGEGLIADFSVINFSRNENLEEALMVDVSVKITYSDTPPQWTTSGYNPDS